MSNSTDKIKQLTRLLYPTGRAFNMPKGGAFEKLHAGLAESEGRAYDDASSILFSILPDNSNFTANDAEDWERRLGLISNASVSLADRKAAIIRKMNHPGDIPARQSWDYLQQSLQTAGFNVFVYENIPEQTVVQILSVYSGTGQQGDGQQGDFQQGDIYSAFPNLFFEIQQGLTQQGNFQQGAFDYTNKVVNNINAIPDQFFPISPNYRSVFFVGGDPLGTFANVPIERKDEFRQLILKIKPVQSVALLFVNYI